MVYAPGGKSARVYPPAELVAVWRLKLVSGFVATTLAPTIAACCRINGVAGDLTQQRLRLGSGRRQQSK